MLQNQQVQRSQRQSYLHGPSVEQTGAPVFVPEVSDERLPQHRPDFALPSRVPVPLSALQFSKRLGQMCDDFALQRTTAVYDYEAVVDSCGNPALDHKGGQFHAPVIPLAVVVQFLLQRRSRGNLPRPLKPVLRALRSAVRAAWRECGELHGPNGLYCKLQHAQTEKNMLADIAHQFLSGPQGIGARAYVSTMHLTAYYAQQGLSSDGAKVEVTEGKLLDYDRARERWANECRVSVREAKGPYAFASNRPPLVVAGQNMLDLAFDASTALDVFRFFGLDHSLDTPEAALALPAVQAQLPLRHHHESLADMQRDVLRARADLDAFKAGLLVACSEGALPVVAVPAPLFSAISGELFDRGEMRELFGGAVVVSEFEAPRRHGMVRVALSERLPFDVRTLLPFLRGMSPDHVANGPAAAVCTPEVLACLRGVTNSVVSERTPEADVRSLLGAVLRGRDANVSALGQRLEQSLFVYVRRNAIDTSAVKTADRERFEARVDSGLVDDAHAVVAQQELATLRTLVARKDDEAVARDTEIQRLEQKAADAAARADRVEADQHHPQLQQALRDLREAELAAGNLRVLLQAAEAKQVAAPTGAEQLRLATEKFELSLQQANGRADSARQVGRQEALAEAAAARDVDRLALSESEARVRNLQCDIAVAAAAYDEKVSEAQRAFDLQASQLAEAQRECAQLRSAFDGQAAYLGAAKAHTDQLHGRYAQEWERLQAQLADATKALDGSDVSRAALQATIENLRDQQSFVQASRDSLSADLDAARQQHDQLVATHKQDCEGIIARANERIADLENQAARARESEQQHLAALEAERTKFAAVTKLQLQAQAEADRLRKAQATGCGHDYAGPGFHGGPPDHDPDGGMALATTEATRPERPESTDDDGYGVDPTDEEQTAEFVPTAAVVDPGGMMVDLAGDDSEVDEAPAEHASFEHHQSLPHSSNAHHLWGSHFDALGVATYLQSAHASPIPQPAPADEESGLFESSQARPQLDIEEADYGGTVFGAFAPPDQPDGDSIGSEDPHGSGSDDEPGGLDSPMPAAGYDPSQPEPTVPAEDFQVGPALPPAFYPQAPLSPRPPPASSFASKHLDTEESDGSGSEPSESCNGKRRRTPDVRPAQHDSNFSAPSSGRKSMAQRRKDKAAKQSWTPVKKRPLASPKRQGLTPEPKDALEFWDRGRAEPGQRPRKSLLAGPFEGQKVAKDGTVEEEEKSPGDFGRLQEQPSVKRAKNTLDAELEGGWGRPKRDTSWQPPIDKSDGNSSWLDKRGWDGGDDSSESDDDKFGDEQNGRKTKHNEAERQKVWQGRYEEKSADETHQLGEPEARKPRPRHYNETATGA